MEDHPPASALLWRERQRADKEIAGRGRRARLKTFALVIALIVLTIAAATGLAVLLRDGAIGL